MNDLPVPQGDWKENHSRQNSKYNAVLAAGIAALVGTIALVIPSVFVYHFKVLTYIYLLPFRLNLPASFT